LDPADEAALTAWLADPAYPKVLHGVKWALRALWARGWTLDGVESDTAIAAYLLEPGRRNFELATLCLRYLGRELTEHNAEGAQLTLDLEGTGDDQDTARRELALRALATVELALALDAELTRREGLDLLHNLELPLAEVLARMEDAGIAADLTYRSEEHTSELQSRENLVCR